MSYYYKYNFVSAEGILSIVREELKSYFDTGSIDDLMFGVYIDKCLKKLGRGSTYITEDVLYIEDFQARLPDNFYAVREAWLCTEIAGFPYQAPNPFYSQAASATTIQISPMVVDGQSCLNPECVNGCDECMPEIVQAVYKTNNEVSRVYRRMYLLKPGNISARTNCDVDYMSNWEMYSKPIRQFTPYSAGYDSFDIRDNKFVTNFRTGVVNLVFYAAETDGSGYQLIPDNYYIKEYIEAFIKFKMFETLTNQVNDETFNQLQQKMIYYKQEADEKYILAISEMRRETAWDKQRRIKKTLDRFKRYELPYRPDKFGWKRNS